MATTRDSILPAAPRRAAVAVWVALLALLSPRVAGAQALDLRNAVRTADTLTNTAVTLSARAELRITGTGDPLAGSTIHLNSPDAWLLMTRFTPSQVTARFLGRVRVNGAAALPDRNVRVVQYAQGAVVIPQPPDFSPLEIFDQRLFTGRSARLDANVAYGVAQLGAMAANIASFKLKRGYTMTIATAEDGTGSSRNYVAQDGDLEVGMLPAALANQVRFVRVFPWRWTGKKGIAGNIEAGLDVGWVYNWNLDRNSPADWEYVPIRQTRWWPGLNQDWMARGASHLLGYNEPDRPDQADMSVAQAIGGWPDLLGTGLRTGAPVVSDGGLGWLYDFIGQADAAGLRVDFVPVHYYRCFGNAGDPAGAANQFYNFLKGIHDVVKRPLWVTEWNNGAGWTSCADPTFGQQQAAVAAIVQMLDDTPFVERHAIFNWVEDVRRVKWDDGSLTPAGEAYRDQVSPLAYLQAMANPESGSSARYAFDGDAHDGWGHGQDAMVVGAPTFTAGKHGQAIALDGAADYLQLSPRIASNNDWSFAGWVYWDGGRDWQRIFDFGESTARSLFLTPRSNAGTLRFGIERDGTQQRLDAPALPVGEWTHVAVTLAGNTGKLFVNGARVSANTSMTLNPNDAGEAAMKYNYLGKSRFSADPLFGGRFDDFRFLSSALTDAEVAAIASTPPPQFRTTTLYADDAPAGQAYSATLAGAATGSGALTFSKVAGPPWLTVGAGGTLGGTPGTADGGENRFIVRVTDPIGSIHTATLVINVPYLSSAVASGADDAEQAADGSVNLTSSDLELVRDDGTGAGDQLVGLRFRDLAIPQGAIITEATIQFTADESQGEPTALEIFAEAADDAAAFAAGADGLGSRALTPLSVPWQPAAWTAGAAGSAQLTPNLAGLVQEVVARPGWTCGNALAILISGSGHRTAESADKPGASPARLTISYLTSPPLLTHTSSINRGSNDAEQAASGQVNLDSSDLELVQDGANGAQTIGLRFEAIPLPAGAVIEGAYIQFTADEAQDEATALTIRAEASADAAVFTTSANSLSMRPVTGAAVAWAPAPWANIGERGPLQRTPDLAALLNEVIDRPGWAGGHAVAFLITGSGHRTANSADKTGGTPATLTVNYREQPPLGSYARWATSHGVASPPGTDPDHDRDGSNLLLEFALGLDPSAPDQPALALASDGESLTFTYARPAAITGLSYQVEWTDSPASDWSSQGVKQQIIGDDGATRTLSASVPVGATDQRYLRLKVSQ